MAVDIGHTFLLAPQAQRCEASEAQPAWILLPGAERIGKRETRYASRFGQIVQTMVLSLGCVKDTKDVSSWEIDHDRRGILLPVWKLALGLLRSKTVASSLRRVNEWASPS